MPTTSGELNNRQYHDFLESLQHAMGETIAAHIREQSGLPVSAENIEWHNRPILTQAERQELVFVQWFNQYYHGAIPRYAFITGVSHARMTAISFEESLIRAAYENYILISRSSETIEQWQQRMIQHCQRIAARSSPSVPIDIYGLNYDLNIHQLPHNCANCGGCEHHNQNYFHLNRCSRWNERTPMEIGKILGNLWFVSIMNNWFRLPCCHCQNYFPIENRGTFEFSCLRTSCKYNENRLSSESNHYWQCWDYYDWCWEKAYGKCPALTDLALKYPTYINLITLTNNFQMIL